MMKRKGIDVPDTLTDNYALRNYLSNVVKSKSQKENNRGEYTLWENVQKHDPSICGAYISCWDLWMQQQASANQTVTVSFLVTIPYDNLIFFENFYEYINFIYADLELNVKVSPIALVWCCVDPKYSLAHGVETSKLEPAIVEIRPNGSKVNTDISTILLDQCANNISIKSEADVYTKRFTQVNSWGRALTNVVVSSPNPLNTTTLRNLAKLETAGHAQLKMTPAETLVAQCESYIVGYNLKQEAKQPMINLCKNKPLVIPCEKYDYVYFNRTYNSSGINSTVTTNFINTKAVAMLYP
jgi:hypothetical protein